MIEIDEHLLQSICYVITKLDKIASELRSPMLTKELFNLIKLINGIMPKKEKDNG